jgi:hypothetical protein
MDDCVSWSTVVLKFFEKTDNIAILILVALVAVLLSLIILWRREDRADKKEAWEVVTKNTEALNGIRLVLASLGKLT